VDGGGDGPLPWQLVQLGRSIQSGRLKHSLSIGQPDCVIFLEGRENTPHGGCAIGRADHEGMQPDDYCCGLPRRVGASLVGQFRYIV
jgi:hypothetical protein